MRFENAKMRVIKWESVWNDDREEKKWLEFFRKIKFCIILMQWVDRIWIWIIRVFFFLIKKKEFFLEYCSFVVVLLLGVFLLIFGPIFIVITWGVI